MGAAAMAVGVSMAAGSLVGPYAPKVMSGTIIASFAVEMGPGSAMLGVAPTAGSDGARANTHTRWLPESATYRKGKWPCGGHSCVIVARPRG